MRPDPVDRDAREVDHEGTVGELADLGVESGRWRQAITNGYEGDHGMGERGETADAGYQVGVPCVSAPARAIDRGEKRARAVSGRSSGSIG